MSKKQISIKLDEKMLKKIEVVSKARYLNRTKAIELMLDSCRIILLEEGHEIVKLLHSIEVKLDEIEYWADENETKLIEKNIRKVGDKLWRLLDLLTEKIQ